MQVGRTRGMLDKLARAKSMLDTQINAMNRRKENAGRRRRKFRHSNAQQAVHRKPR